MASSASASASASAAASASASAAAAGTGVTVREGTASIHFPSSNEVFYNNVQEFNRDLSISVISQYAKLLGEERRAAYSAKLAKATAAGSDKVPLPPSTDGLYIMEALSATGLRSIRYYNEITPQIKSIIANDLKPEAVAAIRTNVLANGLDPDSQVVPSTGDANVVMLQAAGSGALYDVIDLDPYGSASPFLDATMASVKSGGLLAVTCTDMAVLAGSRPETCFSKYGSFPLKKPFCHEGGLRILLSKLESVASMHGKYIEPLMSCSIDFYARVFVRVHKSPREAAKSALRVGHIHACSGCPAFHTHAIGEEIPTRSGKGTRVRTPRPIEASAPCSVCGGGFRVGGPYWLGPIHSREFVTSVLDSLTADLDASKAKYGTLDRMIGRLTVTADELVDAPLYYDLPSILGSLNVSSMKKKKFIAGLHSLGYEASPTHASASGVKTDAPAEAVMDVVGAWAEIAPPKTQPQGACGVALLARPRNPNVDLDADIPPAMAKVFSRKVARFPMNPEANWGPKSRATGKRPASSDPIPAPSAEPILASEAGSLMRARMVKRQKARQGRKVRRRRLCGQFMKTGGCPLGDDCVDVHPTLDQRATIQSGSTSKADKMALLTKLLTPASDA